MLMFTEIADHIDIGGTAYVQFRFIDCHVEADGLPRVEVHLDALTRAADEELGRFINLVKRANPRLDMSCGCPNKLDVRYRATKRKFNMRLRMPGGVDHEQLLDLETGMVIIDRPGPYTLPWGMFVNWVLFVRWFCRIGNTLHVA